MCRAAPFQCSHNSRQGACPFNPVMHAMRHPRGPLLIRSDRQENRTGARLLQEPALPLPKQATVRQREGCLVTSHAARPPTGKENRVKSQLIHRIHSQPLIHLQVKSRNHARPRACTTEGRTNIQSVKLHMTRQYESA